MKRLLVVFLLLLPALFVPAQEAQAQEEEITILCPDSVIFKDGSYISFSHQEGDECIYANRHKEYRVVLSAQQITLLAIAQVVPCPTLKDSLYQGQYTVLTEQGAIDSICVYGESGSLRVSKTAYSVEKVKKGRGCISAHEVFLYYMTEALKRGHTYSYLGEHKVWSIAQNTHLLAMQLDFYTNEYDLSAVYVLDECIPSNIIYVLERGE